MKSQKHGEEREETKIMKVLGQKMIFLFCFVSENEKKIEIFFLLRKKTT